jgi:hypothetical protein
VSAAKRTPEQIAAARTPDQIAADLAVTRNRLAGTIDQLVYRTKPKTILARQVESVKASFYDDQGSLDQKKIAKLVGIGLGVVVAIVAIRKIAG